MQEGQQRKPTKLSFTLHLDIDALFTEFDFLKSYSLKDKNVTYLDENKTSYKAKVSSGGDGQHCHWDRNTFNWKGIGCPIQKVYKPLNEQYKSNINDAVYNINDSVNATQCEVEMEGNFCSGECCLAYIRDNAHNPRYARAENLLFSLLGKAVREAGSWRLLKEYGGTETIEEFRENNTRIFSLEGVVTTPSYFIFKETYYL
jgi:hypothetical protein